MDAILDPVDVKVATVVGFPFGYSATEAKIAETVLAMVDGADEIDVVVNLIALRSGDWAFIERETRLLAEVIHNKGRVLNLSSRAVSYPLLNCAKRANDSAMRGSTT